MKSRINGIIKTINNTITGTSSVHNAFSGTGETHKVYQSDEAGDYIETTYNGITVYVRENYPYYNPQNDKIYYSKEEEAQELYELSKNLTKSPIHDLKAV